MSITISWSASHLNPGIIGAYLAGYRLLAISPAEVGFSGLFSSMTPSEDSSLKSLLS